MHFTLEFTGMSLTSWACRNGVRDVPLTAATELRQPRDLYGPKRAKTLRVEIPRRTI